MSGMACLRNIQKCFNRLSWSPIVRTTQNVRIPEKISRSVGTSSVHKFRIIPAINKATENGGRKIWVSQGFSEESEKLDNTFMHVTLFVTISICLVLGSYVMIYLPDFRMKDWALREAYLELRRRESKGLPPISPDLVDPNKIIIPSDEELGDTEIII